MTDVFISYKRRLRPKVEQIAAALEAMGLDVWFDAELEAGTSFSSEISNRVRGAKCVLVCWSNDAFGHGGDTHGWVIGEASIGRSRGVLVPVLLEPTDLDPPWNTIHSESLVGWSPSSADQSAWHRVVVAIGKHVGRDDLAGQSIAPERVAPGTSPTSMVVVVTFLAAALSAVGALMVNAIPQLAAAIYTAILVDVVLFAIPIAVLLVRTRSLPVLKAVGYVAAFPVAILAALVLGNLVVIPGYTPETADTSEFVYGLLGGLAGGAITLAALPLLGLVSRTPASFIRIAAGTAALTVVGALFSPAFNFTMPSSLVWIAALWQLAYAPVLALVLREPKARQAAPMR